ncbi:MAG TPA: BatD family protein [Patescibacteria group bacterium]|nr:BatD family protein [Patescibacteria group bacterium]
MPRAVTCLLACLLAAVVVWPGAAHAAGDDTIVEARVDAQRIGEGDSLKLSIEVRGSNPGPVEDPDLSGLADFTIAAGPSISTSTSMVWSGGQATSSTSKQFTYVLFPRRRGTLTIPTVSVRIGSRVRQTNPISIEVVQGRLLQNAPPSGRSAGPGIGPRRGSAQPSGEIEVEAQVDKKEIYVGEQVMLTYRIYTQLQLMELPAPQRLPSYTGFWVEEIPVDPRASIHRVTRDGKEFIELTLMKKALFPTTSGDLTVEETVFGMPVKVDSHDPFDSIFFTPTTTLFRKTLPITVKVRALPESGRPASFSGAVGHYTLSVETDRREAKVNDAVGLKVIVKGAGNIRTVGEPLLPPLPDYKKYAPRVDEKKDLTQERLTGTKTWDYVLSPLAPGKQDIPPIKFSWFDPAKGAYVETASPAVPILVMRGEGGAAVAGASPAPSRREVTAFGRDIRYIKPDSNTTSGTPFHRSAGFMTLLAAPVVLNGGLLLMARRRGQRLANAGVIRRRRAPGFARRRLKEARRLLAAGRSREFHQEVARALSGYIGDKLDLSPSGLTHQTIDTLLEARGVGEGARGELQRCLEACDYARFAPVAPGLPEMRELLGRAEQLLARLEGSIATAPRRHGGAVA